MSTPSTLATIRTKVRRLTGRPSPQQITDNQIDDYVNTFYQYDFPEHLRIFTNKGKFKFITEENVDQYNMKSADPSAPSFNDLVVDFDSTTVSAVDVYYNLQNPVYINGYQSFYSQNREQFFRTYPVLGDINDSTSGDGSSGPYTLTFSNVPILQNSITVGAIDNTGSTVKIIDSPQSRTIGNWVINNSTTSVTGSVNYITGAVTITFPNSIPNGNEITFTFTPYAANRPQAVLFYQNTITLRPVPDKPYPVEFEAFLTPAALLSATDNPELKQWWQYLAYGAAKKIFEDSQDPEGVDQIMKGFKEQESLVLNRHIVQQTNERTATIYTEMAAYPYSNFNNRF
jgi:hypothetical protein